MEKVLNNKVWLIGAGIMAQDYIKVLKGLDKDFLVIGRGSDTAKKCEEATGCEVFQGGINSFLSSMPQVCSHAIIAVGAEVLYETTKLLLDYGVKNILVEKPGALHKWQFQELEALARNKKANVLIAYNRRFYASVIKAKKLILDDRGVTSFNFEFTEWSHIIAPLQKAKDVKEKWFLGNSTHVVDLAFYLGGKPREMAVFQSGKLDWHSSASIFGGAGISDEKAIFSYQANWESAGRWSVEMLTKEHRFILRPMEKLQIQKKGSIAQEFYADIDYSLDEKYKPGLFLQTSRFLENNFCGMCTLEEQATMVDVYFKMAGYQ
jgi:predicted dehydrogenase